jgi:phage shock protein A
LAGKPAPAAKGAAAAKGEARKRAAPAAAKGGSKLRGRLAALRREIGELETRIAALFAQRSRVEAQLCEDPMHAGLQAQHVELTRDAAALETRWLEAEAELEAAQAPAEDPALRD